MLELVAALNFRGSELKEYSEITKRCYWLYFYNFSNFKKCQNDQFLKKTIGYPLWFLFKNLYFWNSPCWCWFSLIFTKTHAYRGIHEKTWFFQFFLNFFKFQKVKIDSSSKNYFEEILQSQIWTLSKNERGLSNLCFL